MVNIPLQVVGKTPSDCQDAEIKDFVALVLAGGEVAAQGLEARVRSAVSLAFLTVGCCLCGVAALKSPSSAYRKQVSTNSGFPLAQGDYPYELGWVFVLPSARGHKFSLDLTKEALSHSGGEGAFATSRADNAPMHATLRKFGFRAVGQDWPSRRGDYKLRLFVRPGGRTQSPPIGTTPGNAHDC